MNDRSVIKGENNLYSLLLALLAKWPLILVCGLIFALLGGAYNYRNQQNSIRAKIAASEALEEEEEESDLTKPDYSELRKDILRSLHEKTEYLDRSYLPKIDPAQEARASVDLYVMTDALAESEEGGVIAFPQDSTETQTPEEENYQVEVLSGDTIEADRILDFYVQALSSADVSAMAAELETEDVYVRELIRNETPDYGLVHVRIYTIFPDEEGAEKLLDFVTETLTELKPQAAEAFGKHEILFRNRAVRTVVDDSLFTFLQYRTNEINNLMSAYTNLSSNLKNLDVASLRNTIEIPTLSKKSVVKYAIAGFLGGAVLFSLLYVLYLVLTTKLLSARDLNTVYGFRKLGVIPGAAGKRLPAAERTYLSNPDPEKCFAIINENIKALLPEGQTIGIVSDAPRAETEELCSSLSADGDLRFVPLGDLSEPADLKEMEHCDGVAVAARVMRSTYRGTGDLVRLLADREADVLGSIVF